MTDCWVPSSPKANLRMIQVPRILLKLIVAIHSVGCLVLAALSALLFSQTLSYVVVA